MIPPGTHPNCLSVLYHISELFYVFSIILLCRINSDLQWQLAGTAQGKSVLNIPSSAKEILLYGEFLWGSNYISSTLIMLVDNLRDAKHIVQFPGGYSDANNLLWEYDVSKTSISVRVIFANGVDKASDNTTTTKLY